MFQKYPDASNPVLKDSLTDFFASNKYLVFYGYPIKHAEQLHFDWIIFFENGLSSGGASKGQKIPYAIARHHDSRSRPNGWPVSCQEISDGPKYFVSKKMRLNGLKKEASKECEVIRVHRK